MWYDKPAPGAGAASTGEPLKLRLERELRQ
jgi:hypothetical protein